MVIYCRYRKRWGMMAITYIFHPFATIFAGFKAYSTKINLSLSNFFVIYQLTFHDLSWWSFVILVAD